MGSSHKHQTISIRNSNEPEDYFRLLEHAYVSADELRFTLARLHCRDGAMASSHLLLSNQEESNIVRVRPLGYLGKYALIKI